MWAENRIVFAQKAPCVKNITDEKLAAIAECGMNGIWLRVLLRDIANTSITKRTPKGEQDIAYLRELVSRAGKFGVKVWLFGNEPVPFRQGDDLLAEHPELGGQTFTWIDWTMWCPSEPLTLRYLEEAMRDVFAEVPGLGGFINISHGEGLSTCMDGWPNAPMELGKADEPNCPRCKDKEPWQLHEAVANAIVKGMRASNPDARYLSWFYHPIGDSERLPWVAECAKHIPEGCSIVYNFESGGERTQCGSLKCGGDYWLSFPGPGAPYASVAAAAVAAGTRLGAKIQTCNSHELATLPYIPAPGVLYRKYKELKKAGVKDVLQCWYFGGEPSMMLRAAGELSRFDFSESEEVFLNRFAEKEWGNDASVVAQIWKDFSDAFSCYPFTTSMSYFGPYHTGAIWPLHALPEATELPRSWYPDEPPAGDRICECMMGFSIDEVLQLSSRMTQLTRKHNDAIKLLREKYTTTDAVNKLADLGVLEAFSLHCAAADGIFRFYKTRGEAVRLSRIMGLHDKAREKVAEMISIAKERLPIAARLKELAEADPRLGYHSEAGKRNYDPQMLAAVPKSIEATVAELKAIDTVLARGEPYPESLREKNAVTASVGEWHNAEGFRWRVDKKQNGDFAITAECGNEIPRLVFVTSDLCGLTYPRKFFVPAPGKGEFAQPVEWIEPGKCGMLVRNEIKDGWGFTLTLDSGAWNEDALLNPYWFLILDDTYLPQRKATPIWPPNPPPEKGCLSLIWIKNYEFGRLIQQLP